MNSGSFGLRKWNTNSPELRQLIDREENSETVDEKSNELVKEDDQKFTKETLGPNTNSDEKTKTKILGLNWDIQNDEFYYDFDQIIEFANSLPLTKRSVLKVAAKIYDPLGFLTPVTVKLKEMFRQLCIDDVK